jgi:hypothetical protein
MNGLIIVVWQLVNLRFRPSGTTTIGSTTSIRTDLLASAVLQLDGYDRFTSRNATFFRVQQLYDHHNTTPVDAYIYNYSFALRPEDIQPTGSMNASRIESMTWQIQRNTALTQPLPASGSQTAYPARGNCHIVIYGHNYNIFRVINGFGRLLFTI